MCSYWSGQILKLLIYLHKILVVASAIVERTSLSFLIFLTSFASSPSLLLSFFSFPSSSFSTFLPVSFFNFFHDLIFHLLVLVFLSAGLPVSNDDSESTQSGSAHSLSDAPIIPTMQLVGKGKQLPKVA